MNLQSSRRSRKLHHHAGHREVAPYWIVLSIPPIMLHPCQTRNDHCEGQPVELLIVRHRWTSGQTKVRASSSRRKNNLASQHKRNQGMPRAHLPGIGGMFVGLKNGSPKGTFAFRFASVLRRYTCRIAKPVEARVILLTICSIDSLFQTLYLGRARSTQPRGVHG
jgi:hypothetical protein